MLTTVFSTARTGSTTFVQGLGIDIWFPHDHPGARTNEYYNFFDPANQQALVEKFHKKLKDKVELDDQDIVIKVIVAQLSHNLHIADDIVNMSGKVYHTVRKDYQAQLKSCVHASTTSQYQIRDSKTATTTDAVIEQFHNSLTRSITNHSNIYLKHGGEVIVLEDRVQNRYPNPPSFSEDLHWPQFDTASKFNI